MSGPRTRSPGDKDASHEPAASGPDRISVGQPLIDSADVAAVADAVQSGWISSAGPAILEFEEAWAAVCKREHGVAVSNGTMALEIAVHALDLEPGDEVILPTFTIISCALAVARAGATPVLVDADPRTWTMDVTQVASRITPRTKAIMPVHIYGHPADMAPVLESADENGLAVIVDASEAHGAQYRMPDGRWVPCGSLGTMSTFSFYANKIVTTGEGGMILTDDLGVANRLRLARDLYFESANRFHHERLGYNARFTNIQAALGASQVRRIEEIVSRKRWIGAAYGARLAAVDGLQLPVEEPWARSVYWMYGIVIDEATGIDATTMAARLDRHGIETRPFFQGMHTQPALLRNSWFAAESYPVADRLARQGLYVPSGLGLTEGDIDRVCSALAESLAEGPA